MLRCRSQYCGRRVAEFGMYQHLVSVTESDSKTGPDLERAVGAHFNGPDHKVSDMSVIILEKALESHVPGCQRRIWIKPRNSNNQGMNENRTANCN